MASKLVLEGLGVSFPGPDGPLRAVQDLNLAIPGGGITCLVGESGCGKSLTCRAILRLTPDYARLDGKVIFAGKNMLDMPESRLRRIRGASISMIFQEPMTSLNPVLTVGLQTAEPLRLHLGMGKRAARQRVIELFEQVGIPEASTRYADYPHQLSGGMRQRVMIAMALSCSPQILLADEPTTALDATIQGQILRLIRHESEERGMAVLFITHDLGVVAEIADYVGVMYAGFLMEYATAEQLFREPLHPYTQGLMAAQPTESSVGLERLPAIPGHVPTLGHMPKGCPFHPRCDKRLPVCSEREANVCCVDGHMARCWLYDKK